MYHRKATAGARDRAVRERTLTTLMGPRPIRLLVSQHPREKMPLLPWHPLPVGLALSGTLQYDRIKKLEFGTCMILLTEQCAFEFE